MSRNSQWEASVCLFDVIRHINRRIVQYNTNIGTTRLLAQEYMAFELILNDYCARCKKTREMHQHIETGRFVEVTVIDMYARVTVVVCPIGPASKIKCHIPVKPGSSPMVHRVNNVDGIPLGMVPNRLKGHFGTNREVAQTCLCWQNQLIRMCVMERL